MKYAPEMYGCSESELEGRQLEYLKHSRSPAVPHRSPEKPTARLEYGRWLVDCPCGSGAGVTRKGLAHCFECGRIMKVAKWPDAEFRASLGDAQHWVP